MALRLEVDLESHLGPTQEAYVEIDSIKLSRPNGMLRFSVTVWINEQSSKNFYKEHLDSPSNGAVGLLANKVLYFENEESDGEEVELKIHYALPFTKKVVTEKVLTEKVKQTEKVPYVSFDEDGNEITKYREVIKEVIIDKGTEEVTLDMYDYNVFSDPTEFINNILFEELSKTFPKDKIVKL